MLLVRHTYAPGWLLPGGGVERRETIYQAAVREVQEEAAITAEEEPLLHGVFLNDKNFPGDHVACFVLRKFTAEPFSRNLEIAEATFFALDALPDDTTGGTRRRIGEVVHGAALTRTLVVVLDVHPAESYGAHHDRHGQAEPATTSLRHAPQRASLALRPVIRQRHIHRAALRGPGCPSEACNHEFTAMPGTLPCQDSTYARS